MKIHTLTFHTVIISLGLFVTTTNVFSQGTAFTYQGRLSNGTNAASGSYDLRFALFDAASSGAQQGNLLTNTATGITNGLFTVPLDFGNQFPGANRWLEIAVRTNGNGAFTTLAPRQPLTPTPYAVYSANAGSATTATTSGSAASVAATGITGIIPVAQLPAAVVTNGESGVNISGNFSGNGAGVTNVNLALNSGGAIAWGNFVSNSSPSVGNVPYSVTAADVNGDGKVDLISANDYASTLTVLTNNGSGGFGSNATVVVGSGPYLVTTADVNGDGKPDLISANFGDNTLTVLTNNGSGGFGSNATVTVGSGPLSVTAADVNGDGKVDLISANYGHATAGNTLSVLTNNGSGGFVLASSPVVGSWPSSVTAADVNGDGKVDLISANFGTGPGNTLSVLTNNGSGGFVLASSPGVGNGPYSVVAADVNGDGKVDLISANRSATTLTVLTNNGSGGFVHASSPVVGSGPESVVAADVNSDGKLDLISANRFGDTLTVLTNDGRGGFALASSLGVGSGPASVVAADVNSDGKLDLISANSGNGIGNTLTVLLNTPTFTGIFSGNGAGLQNLNPANLASGSASAAINLTNTANTFSGTFTGNGSGLTALNATNITTGTLADARLSANIALRAGGNGFSGNQIFTNGSVGIGATNPTAKLEINGTVRTDDNDIYLRGGSDLGHGLGFRGTVNGPFLYGYNGGALGVSGPDFNCLTWDYLGNVAVTANLSANSANITANLNVDSAAANIGSLTPGIILGGGGEGISSQRTTNGPNRYGIDFYTASVRRLIIDNSGKVGINRQPTANNLEVAGNASKDVAGSWLANSDARIKEDIVPVTDALDTLDRVRLVSFRYTDDYRHTHPGVENRKYLNVVAQEFRKVFPDEVKSSGERLPDGDEILQVDTYPLTIYAAAAVQELNRKLKIEHNENMELKARLEKLEQLLNSQSSATK